LTFSPPSPLSPSRIQNCLRSSVRRQFFWFGAVELHLLLTGFSLRRRNEVPRSVESSAPHPAEPGAAVGASRASRTPGGFKRGWKSPALAEFYRVREGG
jgi:hypothetical protein